MTTSATIPEQHEPPENRSGARAFSASLLDFARSVLKKWWLFGIIGLVAGGIGYLVAKLQQVQYESSLTFALDEGGSGGEGGGLFNIAAQFGLSMGSSSSVFSGDNIVTILKSRRMTEKVLLSVDTFDNRPQTLIEFYRNSIRKGDRSADNVVSFPVNQDQSKFTKMQDSVLYQTFTDIVKNDLEVWKPDRYLNIYQVKLISPDEKFAMSFTNRLLLETGIFYREMRGKKAYETVKVLEERVAEMKGNLNSSISGKASVQDANVNPAFAGGQVPVLRNQTNIQVYGAAYAEMFKNLEIARYQYLKDIPLLQIIDKAEYPLRKIKASGLVYALMASCLTVFLALIIFWLDRIIRS